MKATVLDASALLALFFDEPGAGKVEQLLHQAAEADQPLLIAAVNWAEVLYRMQRQNGAQGLAGAREFERAMPLDVAPLDRELADSAAQWKTAHALGLAEAFAAALAQSKKAELVTADTEFKALEKEIKEAAGVSPSGPSIANAEQLRRYVEQQHRQGPPCHPESNRF